jgi:hypothetical protein
VSLISLADGWMRFGNGRRWRMSAPHYLVEVDEPGHVPSFQKNRTTVARVREVKSFFRNVRNLGPLDSLGTAVDILTANSFTESLGTVPGPLTPRALREVYLNAPGASEGTKLHQVVLHVASKAKYLERREPGYADPVSSPNRISLGSHHVLISTALELLGVPRSSPSSVVTIVDLVCRLPGDPVFAAELAVKYFNRSHGRHQNQPPLLAATYNAGSPRLDPSNPWNLKQFGEHVDRWVSYFNTSRSV